MQQPESVLRNGLAASRLDPLQPPDEGPDPQRGERRALRMSSFRWCLVLTAVAAALTLVPFWAPLLVASWVAMVFRPFHDKLVKRVGGSGRAAGVVTVLMVLAALTPFAIIGLSFFGAAADLLEKLQKSGGVREALHTLVTTEPALSRAGLDTAKFQLSAQQIMEFAQRHGGGAVNAASRIFGAATEATVGLFVFVYGFYTFLVDGRRAHEWMIAHSPLERWQTQRLSRAYAETGRGLLIGVGLTALCQGVVATVGYLIIDVPQALVLGLLTTFAALIPSIGTGLVWAPLALGLAIAGHMGQAAALVGIGCAISVADNFVRPWLSRFARLDLNAFLLFIAMLGGIAMFGTWGLLAGPLFVRLCVEALRLGSERRELGGGTRLIQPSDAKSMQETEG